MEAHQAGAQTPPPDSKGPSPLSVRKHEGSSGISGKGRARRSNVMATGKGKRLTCEDEGRCCPTAARKVSLGPGRGSRQCRQRSAAQDSKGTYMKPKNGATSSPVH